jgi:hypothetical protein
MRVIIRRARAAAPGFASIILNVEGRCMNQLSVDLYQSATNPDKFLAIPAGVDPGELTGPMVFDKDYAEIIRYQEAFQFDPSESYEGVNAAKIAADILTLKWAMYRRTAPRKPSKG